MYLHIHLEIINFHLETVCREASPASIGRHEALTDYDAWDESSSIPLYFKGANRAEEGSGTGHPLSSVNPPTSGEADRNNLS